MGLTFSFLISSPLVDLASMLMLMSFFGVNFSIAYVVVGLVLAVVGGILISMLKLDQEMKEYTQPVRELYSESEEFNQRQRLEYAKTDTMLIVKNVYQYILVGVGLGALIHNWVPQEMILAVLGDDNPFGVLIATIIGVPIYADIFGSVDEMVVYETSYIKLREVSLSVKLPTVLEGILPRPFLTAERALVPTKCLLSHAKLTSLWGLNPSSIVLIP